VIQTHIAKKKENKSTWNKRNKRFDRKKSHLSIENKLLIYKAAINPIWSYGIELGLRQQVQHSRHAEIPIQNSQSHSKCTPVCHKSYSTYRFQHPLRKWRHPWKNQQTSQSTIRATTTTHKQQETKKMLAFRLTRHLRWHRWINTLPRHSNTWYRSVICIIIILAYKLYSFWLLIKNIIKNLRHTTLGRTPLDEWSARRKDLYLTTHNTHERQTSMTPAGFEPTIPTRERPQTQIFSSLLCQMFLPITQDMESSQHMWPVEMLVSLVYEIDSIRGLKLILGIKLHTASRERRQKYYFLNRLCSIC
jgi:hypothetical protein